MDQFFRGQRDCAAYSWRKGTKHKRYEDGYRLLTRGIKLVSNANRGEIFAVFDGIGSAPLGASAAMHMCDALFSFFRQEQNIPATRDGLKNLLQEANKEIFDWGLIDGTNKPKGGCAGTVAWSNGDKLLVFHAGDTAGLLIRENQRISLTRPHQTDDGAIWDYFGKGSSLLIDVVEETLEEEDRLLLFSDGVTKVMHPDEAADLVTAQRDILKAADGVVETCVARGASDDITVIVVDFEELWPDCF